MPCPRTLSICTVYPNKYAHGFVVLCFVVVMQSFIMNSHEVFIHIHQGCFAGIGAIVRLPQCQWSKPDGYGKISQCITTTKHSKQKPCAYFLGYTVCKVKLPTEQCGEILGKTCSIFNKMLNPFPKLYDFISCNFVFGGRTRIKRISIRIKECYARSRYQEQGQLITFHDYCQKQLLDLALDTCFWNNTSELL